MASGEHASALATLDPAKLPVGWVVTSSGRLSGVTEPGELSVQYPFPTKDLVAIDDALKYASRQSKARFAVYIGDLGGDTAGRAREILADVPTANNAVLLAVSPDQRAIEVVYGADVRGRGAESAAPLGSVGGRVGVQGRQPDRRPGQCRAGAVGRDRPAVALYTAPLIAT